MGFINKFPKISTLIASGLSSLFMVAVLVHEDVPLYMVGIAGLIMIVVTYNIIMRVLKNRGLL